MFFHVFSIYFSSHLETNIIAGESRGQGPSKFTRSICGVDGVIEFVAFLSVLFLLSGALYWRSLSHSVSVEEIGKYLLVARY